MQQPTVFRVRRRASMAVLGAGVLTAGLLTASSATAVDGIQSLSGSNFEIDTDANLVVDNATWIDWASVNEIRKQDTVSGSTDESFGQGTKEDTAAPVIVDGSIPPNKSDLKFFGVYQEGTTSSGFLNLFWSRVQDPSGTTNMDFELNAKQCTPNQTPADADCSANGVTPIRTNGDLLITYDLAKGGTVPAISIREWLNGAWGDAVILTDPQQTKAAGSINTSPISGGANSDGLGAHSPRTFGEAQIDLSAIFDDPNVCQSFGSAYLKSRASDSFTAALKDFVPPEPVNISNCGSVNIVKTDDLGAALNGAEFTLYDDNDPVKGANPPLGDTRGNEDTITNPVLKCTTAGTGTDAGKCTITNVPFGHYWVVETVTPANHDTAADQPAVLSSSATSVTLTFVNPRILQPTISTAQSFVPNDSATVTVGSGRGDLAGSVRFRLYDNQTCTGSHLYDSGAIDVSTGTGTGLSRTVSSANTTAYTTNKTFSWLVEYTSTNDGHLNVTSVCDKERSSITILNNNPNPGSTS
jgi:hypothetical protein